MASSQLDLSHSTSHQDGQDCTLPSIEQDQNLAELPSLEQIPRTHPRSTPTQMSCGRKRKSRPSPQINGGRRHQNLLHARRERLSAFHARAATPRADVSPSQEHCRRLLVDSIPPAKVHAPREYIDLTEDIEQCALCSNVLGQGDIFTARMFMFKTCECVICGQCLLGGFPEEVQVIKFEGPLKFTTWRFWCPRRSHFDEGEQSVYELFGTECSICLDNSVGIGNVRIRTPCGHAFCLRCIYGWAESGSNTSSACPTCKYDLSDTEFFSFKTVQRGVACERELNTEPS